MKYWQEYYLVKRKFSGINIGELFLIATRLKLQLGVNFNVHVFPNWCGTDVKLDKEAKSARETYTHVVESCIRAHQCRKLL